MGIRAGLCYVARGAAVSEKTMSERERRIRRDHEGPWKSGYDESRTDYEDAQYLTEVIDRLREQAKADGEAMREAVENDERGLALNCDCLRQRLLARSDQ